MPVIPKKKQKDSAMSGDRNLSIAYGTARSARKGFAKGGMAMPEAPASIAEAIMRQRKDAARPDSMVDDDNTETPARLSPYDDDNMEAVLKETYEDSEDQIGPEPTDSASDPDEDDNSVASKIRRRMRA